MSSPSAFEVIAKMFDQDQEQDQKSEPQSVQSRKERRLEKRKNDKLKSKESNLKFDRSKFSSPPTLLPPPDDVDDEEVEAELNKYQEMERQKQYNKNLDEVREFNARMNQEAAALLLLPVEDLPLNSEQMHKLSAYKDWGKTFVQTITVILCAVYLLFPNKS